MIPMVSPVRPPEPEYIVQYNGTLEREAVRARQRPPTVRVGRSEPTRQAILAVMAQQPGKTWLLRELIRACPVKENAVYRVVGDLRQEGILEGQYIGVTGMGHGRQLRVWIAR